MSAYVMDKEDIDRMVSAALRAYPAGQPGTGRSFAWWRTDDAGEFDGWNEINRHAETMTGDAHKGSLREAYCRRVSDAEAESVQA